MFSKSTLSIIFIVLIMTWSLCFTFVSSQMTQEEARKMTIKQLRKALARKGIQCKGCVEKDEFVSMLVSNQNLPEVEEKEENVSPKESSYSSDDDDTTAKEKRQRVEELMDTLRKSGMGNAKMFTKEDLEKMEGQSLNKKKKKEEKLKSRKQKKSSFAEGDNIEL